MFEHCSASSLHFGRFLADRIILPSDCSRVCDAVHCGAQVDVGIARCTIVFIGRQFILTS